tara:strand:+ start:156 stop:587 length:432 start_codon:yes stop_codon:yes gene_type:complete
MTEEELHNLLNKAYLMGFNNTCEGYNGEYPFSDNEINPEDDKGWVERRDENINSLVRTNKEEEEVFNPCITKEQWTEWATKTYPEALERAEKLLGDLYFPKNDNPYVFDPTKEPNGFTRPSSRAEVEAFIELEERKANKEGEE